MLEDRDRPPNDKPLDIEIKHTQFALSPNADLRRTFADRTFSKLGRGSLRGSIFALCASAIGSGVLSLPYVLGLCGWGFGLLFMLTGAAAAEISLRMLAHLAVHHGLPNYSKICLKAGGPKLNNLLTGMILVFMFGSCISYQIIVTSLFKYCCKRFGMDPKTVDSMLFSVYQSVPTALLLLLPLSLKRDMAAFRYVSMASIGALLYTGVMLLIEVSKYYKANSPNATIQFGFFDPDMLTGCAMTFFAFQCQVQLLPIYSELVNPNYRRVTKVIDRAIAVDLFFYLTIAVAGYLSTLDSTPKIVLERPAIDPNAGPDYAALVAIFSVMVAVLVAFPVCYNPFRQQFVLGVLKQETFTDKQNWIMTGTFILLSWTVALVYPNISNVLTILGGIAASTLDYAIPTYCYVTLSEHKWTHPKNLAAILFFGFLTLVGYSSCGVVVFEMATHCDSYKDWRDYRQYPGCVHPNKTMSYYR